MTTPTPDRNPMTGEQANPLLVTLPYSFKQRASLAAANAQLQQFVNQATYAKHSQSRTLCAATFGDRYNDLRSLAAKIKQHTLDHLDHYLEQFANRAAAAGAVVHFAADSRQANRICLDIARQNGCKLCVKSKSMVTEETHLVPDLQAAGVETIETDLGEFIVQIDHDAPSHIVQPIIHKDRKAVAQAFVRELGSPYTEEPEELTRIARGHLREKFRRADLGISGANFLVAQSGSMVICTNEGNGRLCTSAPRIHVAFVGIEKLVPAMEHLALFLKLLPRAATGQNQTVYSHIITGPRRSDEHDGPEQVHIILVDNGRSEVLQPESREMLRCIRCGACLNACPVYRKIGGHAYGSLYSGPIGAILTPSLRSLDNYPDLPHASTLCGACYEVCPVKIDIPSQLIRLRSQLVKQHLATWSDRLFYRLWAASLRHPLTYRVSNWMQKVFFRRQAASAGTLAQGDPYSARGFLRHIPGPFAGWTQPERDMPTPTAKSFRDWWKHHEQQHKP